MTLATFSRLEEACLCGLLADRIDETVRTSTECGKNLHEVSLEVGMYLRMVEKIKASTER